MTFKSGKRKQDLAAQQEQIYPAALRYLARRDYSVAELRQQLLQRGADADDLEDVLLQLQEKKFLDDARFANGRVRQRRYFSGRSRVHVRAELRELGVAEELIEAALEEEYPAAAENELVQQLAAKAAGELCQIADAEKRKRKQAAVLRRLLAQGFPSSSVYAAMQELADLPGAEE